jgi:type IV secretory pathway TrbL component
MSRETLKQWLAVVAAILWLQMVGLCVYITDNQEGWLDWFAGFVMTMLALYVEWLFILEAGARIRSKSYR